MGLALTSTFAPAQSRRSRRGSRIPVRAFVLQRWDGELFVNSQFRQDRTAGGAFATKESELTFREGLDLDGAGYVYHPNLLAWDTSLRIGARQQKNRTDGGGSRNDGFLARYRVRGVVLQEKAITFRMFAEEGQSFRDSDFGESSEIRQDRFGLETRIKSDFPATFLVESLTLEEVSSLRETYRDTTHMRLQVTNSQGRDWDARFLYDHSEEDETGKFSPLAGGPSVRQDLSRTRDEATLTHALKFGPDRERSSLRGRFRFRKSRGSYNSTEAFARERLELAHSTSLSSYYSGSYTYDETEDQREQRITGEIGLIKKIYRSLELEGRGNIETSEFDDGKSRFYGVSFDARYRKRTPIGRYSTSLNVGRQYRQQESESGRQFFRDERVTLTGLIFSTLNNPNADNTTVVVTNSNGAAAPGTTIYVENIDYVLRTTGAFTEIARLPGSAITDGDVVLVSYTANVARDAAFTTDRLRWSNRLRLKGLPLSVYTRLERRDEKLVSGQDPGNLEKMRRYLVGARFKDGDLAASLEYEVVKQELSPTTVTTRGRVDYRALLVRNTRLALGLRAERRDYRDASGAGLGSGDDYNESAAVKASLTTKLGRRTLIRFGTSATKSRGRGESTEFRNEASLEWSYGKLDFSIGARYDILRQESSERNTLTVTFDLTRSF